MKELRTLNELLRTRAEQYSDKAAYTFLEDKGRGEVLTYQELARRVRTVAGYLQSQGVSGQRVLLLYPAGLQFIEGFWGCIEAGAIPVPAYPPHANHHVHRLKAIIKNCDASFALT